jgi:hypothetical protein
MRSYLNGRLYSVTVSKEMFLACSYPWKCLLFWLQRAVFQESTTSTAVSMDTFNTQRWFMSKNRISAETCLPIRFLEKPTCHNIVTCTPIVRQRVVNKLPRTLDKQSVARLLNNRGGRGFCVVRSAQQWKQRGYAARCQATPLETLFILNSREAAFSLWSVPKAYKRSECSEIEFSRKRAERIETRSTGKYRRSVCEDFECEIRVEDFMHAVEQWYWECVI